MTVRPLTMTTEVDQRQTIIGPWPLMLNRTLSVRGRRSESSRLGTVSVETDWAAYQRAPERKELETKAKVSSCSNKKTPTALSGKRIHHLLGLRKKNKEKQERSPHPIQIFPSSAVCCSSACHVPPHVSINCLKSIGLKKVNKTFQNKLSACASVLVDIKLLNGIHSSCVWSILGLACFRAIYIYIIHYILSYVVVL